MTTEFPPKPSPGQRRQPKPATACRCSLGALAVAALWLASPARSDGATANTNAAPPSVHLAQAGRALETGNYRSAITNLEAAAASFQTTRDTNASVRTALMLADAWQSVGQPRRTIPILERAAAASVAAPDSDLTALVQARLGAALLLTPDRTRALSVLQSAAQAARDRRQTSVTAAVLNDLGTLHLQEDSPASARASLEEALQFLPADDTSDLRARILLNLATAARRAGDSARSETWITQAVEAVDRLPASHAQAFLLLSAGQVIHPPPSTGAAPAGGSRLAAQKLFARALTISESLGDRPMQSYALGYLSGLYAEDNQLGPALKLAQRAVFAAQESMQPEALYRWEWQVGRLLRRQGDLTGAVAAYRRATQTLQSIRSDVSSAWGGAEPRRSFRETEGPLFQELADLLLAQAGQPSGQQQALLAEARDTIELLKAVELEDYFCDDCVDWQRLKLRRIESIDARSAVVYLIPLPDRTEILLGMGSGLERYTAPVTAAALAARALDLRRSLETRTTYSYLVPAKDLYDWLVRPLRSALDQRGIDTLVFVPDGALRTVPMAALYDGERFLIETMAVAVAPGLSLTDPRALDRGTGRTLLNGLSRGVQGFAPLEFVESELQHIGADGPGETLLNETFTLGRLRQKLAQEQFSVVHIASHGQFGRDARRTFVLTYDGKLTLNDLELAIRPGQYRGRPLELLVLSACQTAAGDDRAALGLAGVAVKAGARSALASLWFVNDQSTAALTTAFYRELRKSPIRTKAQALRAAQLELLHDRRYRHPCYWSPYLIIGNWL